MNCRLPIVWLTTCLLIGLTTVSFAQTTTLTGYVTDAATGKVMPFANVYLNGSTRGTLTNDQGHYALPNVPLGTVDVVASFVGYVPQRHTLRLDDNKDKRLNFRLQPSDQTLATVTVRANSRKWQQHLKQFKRQLFGEPFGGQCQIMNPEVLMFHDEAGHLKATATEPLVIENAALGYRIYYELLYFDGSFLGVYYAGASRFEELTATSEQQVNRFGRNRMRAYQGSLRHLMACLVSGTYEQKGFMVYREDLTKPRTMHGAPATLHDAIHRYKHLLPISLDTLIRPGKLAFERRLISTMPLVVFYTNSSSAFSPYQDARYAYSQLTLPRGEMQLTTDGDITMPNGLEVKGSLADDRLSTLLPADWKPVGTEANPSGSDSTDIPFITQGQLLPADARLGRIATTFSQKFAALAPVLFVHTDKPFYATGDRLWLSAYLLDAATNRRLPGETAIHVDLLTPAGTLVQHQWLRVTDGRTSGDFRLSDSLASGTYRLRAYTDEDDGQHRPAFERPVAVYNVLQSLTEKTSDTTRRPIDVQVLPEGGRWLAGLASRLGVKAIGPDGLGRRVSGRIVSETGVEVSRFSTNSHGMGSVVVTPLPGRKYYAEVAYNGRNQLVALLPVEQNGLALSVDMVSDTNRLTLQITSVGWPKTDSVYVLIQQQGRLVDQRKILLQNGVARISLPVATLPPGLCQLTLYDDAARPQAERLVFLPERVPPVRVLLGVNKARYQPREQAILSVTLNDDGLPVVAALSASITDAEQVPNDTASATIHTHLLLTGELRGRVEHPNQYLKNTAPETRRALDDLLLTQGWRRVSGTPATELLGGVSLMGRVLNAKNQPIADAQVIVASTVPNRSFVRSAGANERGRFRLAGLDIADTLKLMVQLADRQLKNLSPKEAHVVFDGPGQLWRVDSSSQAAPDWEALQAQLAAAKIRQESDAALYRDKTAKLLKEVTVRAKRTDDRPEDIRRASLHSGADATLTFDDKSPRFGNLYEMIRGRVAGVSVMQNSLTGAYQVIIRGVGSLKSNTQPLFLLDGVPIQDTDGMALLTFNPGDIERIEVLKNSGTAGIYGVRGGNGVIAFYSKRFRPDQQKNDEKAGMRPVQLIGYPSVQREFYVPRYDPKPIESQPAPEDKIDRRDVLYWKPIMQTDSQGHSQLLISLSDVVRTVRVVVQGVTADGRPVVGEALIRVQ